MRGVSGAGDQVAFSVPRDGTILDVRRAVANGHCVADLSPPGRPVSSAALRALGAQMREQLALQNATRVRKQGAIDRFVGHGPGVIEGMLQLQPPGNVGQRL